MTTNNFHLHNLEKLTVLTKTQINSINSLLDTVNKSSNLPLLDNTLSLHNVILTALELAAITTTVLNQEISELYDISYEEEGTLINNPGLIVHSLNVDKLDEEYQASDLENEEDYEDDSDTVS